MNFVVGAPHLRDIFYRMGLSDKDIVALSGGHTLVYLSSLFHLFMVFFCNRNTFSPHFVFSVVTGKGTCREIGF